MSATFGIHIYKGKNPTTLVAIAKGIAKFDISAIQIFVKNPRNGSPIKIGNKQEIAALLKEKNVNLVVHVAYKTSKIWNKLKKKRDEGADLLIDQMEIAKKIGAIGVVVHLPKNTCEYVVDVLTDYKKRINNTKIKLLLEHPTFKADELQSYEMPHKLNRLTKEMKRSGIKQWGYTIDTAHLWSAITLIERKNGFKIETYKGADKWIKSLDKKTRDKIKLIHLNGSRRTCCCNKDEHAIPIYGNDKMWKKYDHSNNFSDSNSNSDSEYTDSELAENCSILAINTKKSKVSLAHDLNQIYHQKENKKNKENIETSGFYRFIRFAMAKKIMIVIEMTADLQGKNELLRSIIDISNIIHQ